jgi:hypothetical protein
MADLQPQVFDYTRIPPSFVFPGHIPLWQNMLGVLSGAEPPIIKKEETLNVTAGIEAFYRSAETGRDVVCRDLK